MVVSTGVVVFVVGNPPVDVGGTYVSSGTYASSRTVFCPEVTEDKPPVGAPKVTPALVRPAIAASSKFQKLLTSWALIPLPKRVLTAPMSPDP